MEALFYGYSNPNHYLEVDFCSSSACSRHFSRGRQSSGELDGLRIHDINNVQGMMLFNIGDAEMTVGELTLQGLLSRLGAA